MYDFEHNQDPIMDRKLRKDCIIMAVAIKI